MRWKRPAAKRCQAALVLLGLGVAPSALAQAGRAFQMVELGVGVVHDAGMDGPLHQDWRPRLGIEVTARTPFYAGTLELGLQQTSHAPKADAVPGFRARLFFAGWRQGMRLSDRAGVTAGFRLGMYEMRFETDAVPASRRHESELGAAVRSSVGYRIGDAWRATGAVAYQTVFTSPSLEQLLLSAGIVRTFGMPSWLRDFLE